MKEEPMPKKTTPEKPPSDKMASKASKALPKGAATKSTIKSMAGRIESERSAVAKKAAAKKPVAKAKTGGKK
jgi:hypothetical protein